MLSLSHLYIYEPYFPLLGLILTYILLRFSLFVSGLPVEWQGAQLWEERAGH